MKLVFFSPFLAASAIGRVTALIVDALYELGHTAVVVRTEQEHLLYRPAHTCRAEVIGWRQDVAIQAAVEDADAVIYQIGDNFLYHCGCLHWLPRVPGIVCLHDFFVAHLFMGWAQGRHAEAERILNRLYGEGTATEFFASAGSTETFIRMASKSAPMTEWICGMADSVVSHSNWGMARVANSCPGPLRVLALPYDAPAAAPVPAAFPGAAPASAHINILTVGNANANKRIESVIHAIGASATLRSRAIYRLCGSIDPLTAETLAALARTLDVNLLISGSMDDASLQKAFNEADIVCSLRWPSLEAASASTIESLLYGKAVIVTDTGFYNELPHDCVYKIAPDNEAVELKQALEHLCTHPEMRHGLAQRGQRWAAETFLARNYAEQLLLLAPLTATAGPTIRMVNMISTQLDQWGASSALLNSEDIAQPLEIFETLVQVPPGTSTESSKTRVD